MGELKRIIEEKDSSIAEFQKRVEELKGFQEENAALKKELQDLIEALTGSEAELEKLGELKEAKGKAEENLQTMKTELENKEERLLKTISHLKAEQKRRTKKNTKTRRRNNNPETKKRSPPG
jgi:DNA anti-recombination protein RmuC